MYNSGDDLYQSDYRYGGNGVHISDSASVFLLDFGLSEEYLTEDGTHK